MKSKTRRVIDKWVKQEAKVRRPVYIAEGQVFIVPSDAGKMHTVTQLHRHTPKNVFQEWTCSCTAFWYSGEGDSCRHIEQIKTQLLKAKMTLLKKSG